MRHLHGILTAGGLSSLRSLCVFVRVFILEHGAWGTHPLRPLISVALSSGGSGRAGCCWSAAPVSGAPGSAAETAEARLGSTSGTGSVRRTPQWPPPPEATGSCCWSSGRCRTPAGAASTRRSRCPARAEKRMQMWGRNQDEMIAWRSHGDAGGEGEESRWFSREKVDFSTNETLKWRDPNDAHHLRHPHPGLRSSLFFYIYISNWNA